MRRRVKVAAIVTTTAMCLVGAGLATIYWIGPEPTKGLTYDDVDAGMLAKTTLVVATSRQIVDSRMHGSTLLIDSSGHGKRIDNDGLDGVKLAYDGSLVGFADVGHDYLLGSDRAVRPRTQEAPQSVWATHLSQGRLVSLFDRSSPGGGFRVAESDVPERNEPGWVMGTADCAGGVWAAVGAGGIGDPSAVVEFRQIAPASGRAWPISTDSGTLQFQTISCRGHTIVGVGEVTGDDERAQQVVGTLDLRTGDARLVNLDRPRADSVETPWFPDATLRGRDLYVVQRPPDSSDHAELWRIDPTTGRTSLIAHVPSASRTGALDFRFDGNVLYVLNSTYDEPSVLTALDTRDGSTVGRLEMDPLSKMVNGPFTTFENAQFVDDFVVLQPTEEW